MSYTIVKGENITLVVDEGPGPQGPQGLQGPPGPVGPPGTPGGSTGDGSGVDLLFTFASPSTTWTMVHGLDTFALVVETFDHNGVLVEGELQYVDANTVQVTWYYPNTGYARIFN